MHTLIATASQGIESLIAKELNQLGYKTKTEDGQVSFQAELTDICRTNLRLRCADRILLEVARFPAATWDELFFGTKDLPWENYIPRDGAFPVTDVSIKNSKLLSKRDCQKTVKKAIVDRLKVAYTTQELPETGAQYPIRLYLNRDTVSICLDTTGEGLHMRGYRSDTGIAPLRENLAAAMVMLSGWKPDKEILYDPFCGSGTILIEAAMIALNIAPGGNRHFVSEKWSFIAQATWIEERDKCYSEENLSRTIEIAGSDIEQKVIRTAGQNAKNALPDIRIKYSTRDFFLMEPPAKSGVMISNLPFGERLSNQEDITALYRKIGPQLKTGYANWSYHFLTAEQDLPRHLRIPQSRNRKMYNGGLKCYLHQFFKIT